MNRWVTLLKKDLRFNSTLTIIHLIFIGVMSLVFLYVASKQQFAIAFFISVVFLVFHVFTLPFLMLNSLTKEWRLGSAHLWLNLPQKGISLITAKFVAALIHTIVMMALATGIVLLMAHIDLKPDLGEFVFDQFFNFMNANGFSFFFSLIFGSALLATLITFVVMVARSIRKWGWPIGSVIIGLGIWGHAYLQTTELFRKITEWGVIGNDSIIFQSDVGDGSFYFDGSILYFGSLLFDIVLMIAILILSGWILDRKAEAN